MQRTTIGLAAILMLQIFGPAPQSPAQASSASASLLIPKVCSGLSLSLQPGVLDATGALKVPASSDIPLDPVVVPVPLMPGSTPSHTALPISPAIPPVLLAKQYLKTAAAEYALTGSMSAAVSWYKAKLARCGYTLKSSGTSSHGVAGPQETDYTFVSPTTPSLAVRLSLEQSASGNLLLLYYAWSITLPARPQSSIVTGAVQSIQMTYILPGGKSEWKVKLTNAGDIAAIIGGVNVLQQDVGVHSCFGSQQEATLHVHQGARTLTYSVEPGCYDVWIGKQLRLFDANHAVWNAVRAAVYDYCLGHTCKKTKA